MAIQYPDFRADPNAVPQLKGLPTFVESLQKGYQMAQLPEQMRMQRAMQQQQLQKGAMDNYYMPLKSQADLAQSAAATQGQQLQNQYYPQDEAGKQALMSAQAAQANAAAQKSNDPSVKFTGDVENAYNLQALKDAAAKDPSKLPYYEAALGAYNQGQTNAKSLNDYRQVLMQTAPARSSSALGKLTREQQDVTDGYLPGSNRQTKLNPVQQSQLAGQYGLATLKNTTDAAIRQKNLYSQNIDKTLATIDPNVLTQYSGLIGGSKKSGQEALSQIGKESPAYDAYLQNTTSAALAAKQIRQFLGDSVQPAEQKDLADLANPSTWKKNPKQAKAQFDRFVQIYQNEKGTYTGALQSPGVYTGQQQNAPQQQPTQPQRNPALAHMSDAQLLAMLNGGGG